MQEKRNSSALAMELRLSCTNPSIYEITRMVFFSAAAWWPWTITSMSLEDPTKGCWVRGCTATTHSITDGLRLPTCHVNSGEINTSWASYLWGNVKMFLYFYASAFRHWGHYVFGLSIHPFVRPQPKISSFQMYMGPLVHPTNRDRFSACPSVRIGFQAFPGESMEGIAWYFYAGVSWPPSELIKFWSWSVDFPPFGIILTQCEGLNLGFLGISVRMHGVNGLKFYMLMYPDHLQK